MLRSSPRELHIIGLRNKGVSQLPLSYFRSHTPSMVHQSIAALVHDVLTICQASAHINITKTKRLSKTCVHPCMYVKKKLLGYWSNQLSPHSKLISFKPPPFQFHSVNWTQKTNFKLAVHSFETRWSPWFSCLCSGLKPCELMYYVDSVILSKR